MRRFHIAFNVSDGVQLIIRLVERERIFELALHVRILRKGCAHSRRSLRIKLQQLLRHVLHGLLHARFGLRPRLIAELVQLRSRTRIGRPILLNQIKPRQRNVQLRIIREVQNHQLKRQRIRLLNGAQPLILRNTMLNVDDIITHCEVTKIRNKRRRFRFPRRPRMHVRIVGKIVCPEDEDLPSDRPIKIQNLHAIGDRCAHNYRRAQVPRQVAGFRIHGRRPCLLRP